ncbi:YjcZ family sporulation protein [Alkalihalobacillus sp. LMS39]|nr:YjcZ family sporulation protein [Alkalihalobacillus sp. LMS39]
MVVLFILLIIVGASRFGA